MKLFYDVIVVGAGHAGCEAAHAAAQMGAKTCLITMDMNKIAQMSCNPAVGGIAKGQIVREIDALGGGMGLVTDACAIQFRMLNKSKGPAMWSPRAQCDRGKFIWKWRELLDHTPNLDIWQDQVEELITEPHPALPEGRDKDMLNSVYGKDMLNNAYGKDMLNNANGKDMLNSAYGKDILNNVYDKDMLNSAYGKDILNNANGNPLPSPRGGQGGASVTGVRTIWGCELYAPSVIITAGTFLNGLMHIGRKMVPGGRCAEPAALHLTESINALGIRSARMKTGTPVRIDKRTVHFEDAEIQPGEDVTHLFSFMNKQKPHPALPEGRDNDMLLSVNGNNLQQNNDMSLSVNGNNLQQNNDMSLSVNGNNLQQKKNDMSLSVNGNPLPSPRGGQGGASRGASLLQLPCWTFNTTPECHEILMSGLADSPLYNGQIQSIGPRYCPSIETKLHTFPDRNHHPLFLEPEGTDTNEMYLNGFSSSLPMDIQLRALHAIPALRDVKIYRPGYAIEYDFFDPTQLTHSLESKLCSGLFFAGQVNGTTGYEEAAGQGIIAGINAALHAGHLGSSQPSLAEKSFILHRDEAYIGVLIDDLVTKGVDEPYRMFTSRAEYRILLRQDNADARLTEKSYAIGLATSERNNAWLEKKKHIADIIDFCRDYNIKPKYVNAALESIGSTPLSYGCKLSELIARPGISIKWLAESLPKLKQHLDAAPNRKQEIAETAEIQLKYSGYIDREIEAAGKMHRLENIHIKGHFDYDTINALSIEARQKLKRIDPETLAQASRIPGVSPSDISVLLVMMGR